MEKKKEIITVPAKPLGRPRFEFTQERLRQIYDLASIMCTKQEIGTIIGCSHDTIERNEKAMEKYRTGVANAKATIRRTQFKIMQQMNSSTMAAWLGKVYLRQDKDDEQEDYKPLPLGDVIDL
jgi:IS30 family transposase